MNNVHEIFKPILDNICPPAQTCEYAQTDEAPYPRGAYRAGCGYQMFIVEGYKIGASNERLSELNEPSGNCRKCGCKIRITALNTTAEAEGGRDAG